MFNTRLIREDDAILQFEALAWLMRTYGPTIRPTVPSPLHKSKQLNDLCHDEMDTRSVYVWAEDSFGEIKHASNMSEWEIGLVAMTGVPQDGGLEMHVPPNTDVVLYDPSRCEDAGYFPAITLMQLAEIQCQPFQPEAGLSPLMQGMLILASGAYNGQGFALANLVPDVSEYLTAERDVRRVPFRIIENTLCFATCLNLMTKRQSPEQIVATYGTLMPTGFRKKIRQACRQIETFQEELKLLQILAEPKAQNLTDQLHNTSWGPRADVA
ncbi:hypothetical protein ACJ3XI_02635 [Litorimonas sp. RW-G-Af-16]|uniref:hypothetical protein n=1 Tax=Litorimonas sp. RW-G-Af-16 TaxID=3241168 RepID=UPI00390C4842